MRLWPRLAAVMTALAVVPVVLVGWQAFRTVVAFASAKSEENLWAEARLKTDLLGRWVHDLAPIVDALPEMVDLAQLSPAGRAGFTELVARVLPPVQEVVLIDVRGQRIVPSVVVGALDPSRPDLIGGLPLAEVLASPDHVHMGAAWPPAAGRTASFPLAVVANPTAPAADRWVLGLRVAVDPGVDLVANASDTHAVLLLDEQGRVLLGEPRGIVDPARLVPLLGNEAAFRTEQGAGARGVLVPVPWTPGWSLVVADSSTSALASAAAIQQNMAPQLVVAVVCAVALAFLFAGTLSGPVERLRDAVLRIAEGVQGVRASVQRTDEIGDLARAFDHLAARLEANRAEIAAQQEEIEAFNRELQGRVEERTRELKDAQEGLVRSGQLAAVAEIGAGLAHELNNPLAAVLGLAQVLKSRHPGESLLDDLEVQAARCREVVETLRRVQSLEVDGTDAPVVSVGSVLAEAVALVGGPFRRRGVGLVLEPVDPALVVQLEPVSGARILVQILNALRAGLETGATVTVSAAAEAPHVAILLRADRGLGSDPDRKDDWMASGHGLWVARQLLQRLGGQLDERASPRGASGVEWCVAVPGPRPATGREASG